jgi:hypothetical protein
VEHREKYCHSKCGNDCEAACSVCDRTTLTSLYTDPQDSIEAAIKHATGEAQRRAKRGESGSIRVETSRYDADTGKFKTLILDYNTDLKKATATKPSG